VEKVLVALVYVFILFFAHTKIGSDPFFVGIGCPIAEILQKNRFFIMAYGNQYTNAFFITFY